MACSSDPQILRPKPRRSFANGNESSSPLLNTDGASSETPSRTHSILNLTSSTLLGIYSPTGYNDRSEDPPSPWGTGAETPLHSLPPRLRRKSVAPQFTPQPKPNPLADAISIALRIILLSGMGMGYGVLVRHLHDDRQLAPFQVEGIIKPSNNWTYLAFWGVVGALLGSLLPWLDGFFESDEDVEDDVADQKEKIAEASDESGIFNSDWTPVVRIVGAFAGIAFAIRKLPWASTLQASLALALVNPVLWYLVDRSKPGFVFSIGVGFTGTAVLLASNPDMMPSPALQNSRNSSIQHTQIFGELKGVGNIVSRESVEGGIWIWSVLFCSCVCFGNIGRRLALITGRKMERKFASRTVGVN